MDTFNEAVSNFVAPGTAELAELKKTFASTLADLRDLKRGLAKQKAVWQSRMERIHFRRQQAQSCGVHLSSVASRLEELGGGRVLHGGLIPAIERQIDEDIFKIERVSLQDNQQRRCIYWYSEPQKVRANMADIEKILAELENIVHDGGTLHREVENKSGQPASAPVLASSPRDPATITVEM